MLRPASPDALLRLQTAALGSDRELDHALCDVGVLPPLDLHAIRLIIGRPGVDLGCQRNSDGHAIVEVRWDSMPAALIHHDGRVQMLSSAAA